MSYFSAINLKDENGLPYGVKHVNNKPRVSSMPYLYDIAEGNVTGHVHFDKIGYTVVSGTTIKDVWSYTDVTINLPTTATAMEVYTAAAQDRHDPIFSGTDNGGSLVTLVDTAKNFNAGTPVLVGDCIVLNKSTSPSYGFVTAITNNTTLAVAGGFSDGLTANGKAYTIIKVDTYSGVHAVLIEYLTTAFAEKSEIVLLGGATTGVNLINVDVFRVQSMKAISTGTAGVSAGAIQLWDADGSAPIYSYITLGYTRARNSCYTVPAGKTLYLVQFVAGYATSVNKVANARIILKATQNDEFKISAFMPMAEILCPNSTTFVEFIVPLKIVSGVTLKFTAVPTESGQVTTVLRGWIE